MRSNSCRHWTTLIYMPSVMDFDPKLRNHFRGRSSCWATFGHTGCWLIAKRRFSAKFSKSFDNHGKTKKKCLKKSFEKRKNLNFLEDLWVTVEPVLATTWQKRPPENCGHTISVPWIHGFKCTECVLEIATTWEMRIADTEGRPKALIQPAKKRPHT